VRVVRFVMLDPLFGAASLTEASPRAQGFPGKTKPGVVGVLVVFLGFVDEDTGRAADDSSDRTRNDQPRGRPGRRPLLHVRPAGGQRRKA
jgi:hypothetical protein